MTPNMRATMDWLKAAGLHCSGCETCRNLATEQGALDPSDPDDALALAICGVATPSLPQDQATQPETRSLPTMQDETFTFEQRGEMSRAFSAGNYANAYESTDLDDHKIEDMSEHERAAFVLGFFGSYSLDEIGSDREIFDECYHSAAGRYMVNVARYTDSRAEEYATENGEF